MTTKPEGDLYKKKQGQKQKPCILREPKILRLGVIHSNHFVVKCLPRALKDFDHFEIKKTVKAHIMAHSADDSDIFRLAEFGVSAFVGYQPCAQRLQRVFHF